MRANNNQRILIIDKNHVWRKWAYSVLSENGYVVVEGSTFAKARKGIEKNPDCLVLISVDIAKSNLADVKIMAGKKVKRPAKFLVISPIRLSYNDLRDLWLSGVVDIQRKPRNKKVLLDLVGNEFDLGNGNKSSKENSNLKPSLAGGY